MLQIDWCQQVFTDQSGIQSGRNCELFMTLQYLVLTMLLSKLSSHDRLGNTNINTELYHLHDSKGEPGEEDNVKIVQDFIQRRRSEPALKDQLHAVW